MPPTYDSSLDTGKVRLLISDIGGSDGNSFIFEDEEIVAFLDLSNDSVNGAAAYALRTIASNEIQVQKRIKFLELSTDGPACAKELRTLADTLDQRAEEDEGEGFDIADMNVGPFSARNLRRKNRA